MITLQTGSRSVILDCWAARAVWCVMMVLGAMRCGVIRCKTYDVIYDTLYDAMYGTIYDTVHDTIHDL